MDESQFGWLSILPPLLAIVLAIATRQVVWSLLAGIALGWTISAGGNVLAGLARTLECLVSVFADAGNTRVILFTLLMGSLLALMQRSGGVSGFVEWASRWRWSNHRRGAQLMAAVLGLGVFIESTITCLVVGTVARPVFDRLRISREKLAYLCDATSAPVCVLIPFNGWGAFVLGLLGTEAAAGHLGESVIAIFLKAVTLNFYALFSVLLVFVVAMSGKDFGPMRRAEARARGGMVLRPGAKPVVDEALIGMGVKEGVRPGALKMLGPLGGMVLMVLAGIAITGWQGVRKAALVDPGLMDYLEKASGSTAVLWGVLFGLMVAVTRVLAERSFGIAEVTDLVFKGAGGLVPLAAIMWLAFGIGATCGMLGTGPWLAQVAKPYLTAASIAPLVFLVACLIAFSTGTSWGTFAIMMPLAVPLAASFNAESTAVSIPLVVAAVLGGGVFGDHCSPISDTTVVSSMAACSDHIDHVRTQLPYALVAAGGALVLYWAVGLAG